MMLHPDHAGVLAKTRHRELLAEAQEGRLARLAGPRHDCRLPTRRYRGCRPDLRRVRRRGPSGALWDHRRIRALRR